MVATAITLGLANPAAAGMTDIDRAAALISSVAPEHGGVVVGRVSNGIVEATTYGRTVKVPLNPSGSVSLPLPERGSSMHERNPSVEVGIPVEVNVMTGRVAGDGTVVYQGAGADEASAAVQVLGDGTVRLQTISRHADSSQFTYSFGAGIHPALTADGGAVLVADSGQLVAQVSPPWAVDANGLNVPTHYEDHGDTLVQIIDIDESTALPVVADPSIRTGVTWTGPRVWVKYNKTETKVIGNTAITNRAKYAAVICAVIPSPVVATACGLIAYDSIGSVANTFKAAAREGKCLEMGYLPVIVPSSVAYLPVSWEKAKC